MLKQIFTLLFIVAGAGLVAQPDAYTQQLVDQLSVQFTLTDGTFPVYDTEDEFQRLSETYGLRRAAEDISGQDFTKILSLNVRRAQPNRWDSAWRFANLTPISRGDKILWVVYLRLKPGVDNPEVGKVTLFAERTDNFDKEVEVSLDIGTEWRQYFLRFETSTRSHPARGLFFGAHLGQIAQHVEIGGTAVINYGPNVPLTQLPENLNSGQYGGFEADAPWRAEAASRIDELRKADLSISVVGTDGEPVPDANVKVSMQQHDFKFGTAVKGSRFVGGREFNQVFVQKLFDLDGKGHGFNAVVFENDLKWPGWEEEWITTNRQLRRTIDFLNGRDIHMRGHVLLWPGWENMPSRMQANAGNPDYLKAEVENHLVNMLETEDFDTRVTDWDVINEINTNKDLAAALAGTPGYTTGREIYAEVFKRARELAPDASLYINDYITLSLKNQSGSIIYDQYVDFIEEMIAAGAPLDGIGFQGHLGSSPNSIYEVEQTYDDFYNRFGLEAKITEFDLPRTIDPEVAPTYLKDFLTITFSHPSMTGFFFWNWWDVDTWANPGVNLYDRNWNEKPSHEAFTDLVFNEWWTEETVRTGTDGKALVRGFKGQYTVELTCDAMPITTSVKLGEDTDLVLDCNELLNSTTLPPLPDGSVKASPNPSNGPLLIENLLPVRLRAELMDMTGRQVWKGELDFGQLQLNLDLPAGTYQLRFTDGLRAGVLPLVRQ